MRIGSARILKNRRIDMRLLMRKLWQGVLVFWIVRLKYVKSNLISSFLEFKLSPHSANIRLDSKGGGVAILVQEHLESSVVSILPIGQLEVIQIEIVISAAETINVASYYEPNLLSKEFLEISTTKSSNLIICGDLNARSPGPGGRGENQNGKILLEACEKQLVVVLNTTPTTIRLAQQPTAKPSTMKRCCEVIRHDKQNRASSRALRLV